jgi:hypothetical protein
MIECLVGIVQLLAGGALLILSQKRETLWRWRIVYALVAFITMNAGVVLIVVYLHKGEVWLSQLIFSTLSGACCLFYVIGLLLFPSEHKETPA